MQIKTRWILVAAFVTLFVVSILIWRQLAPVIVASSLETTVLAKLSEPVPLGAGKEVGRWHWEKTEKVPWGVRVTNLELRSDIRGERVFRVEEASIRQQSRGVVVTLSRWDGLAARGVRGRGAYAETLVRGAGDLQDIRIYDVKVASIASAGSSHTAAPEISAERIDIGFLDKTNGASGIRANTITIARPEVRGGEPSFMLGRLEIDRIGPDGLPRRVAARQLQMVSAGDASEGAVAQNLIDLISVTANPAPDPISFVEVMIADIHNVANAERNEKGAAEFRAEIKESGRLGVHIAGYRANSGVRGQFEIGFIGGKIRNFHELSQEIRTAQIMPMMNFASLELYDAGAQMRGDPDWQQLRSIIPTLQKAGILSRGDARKIDVWLAMRPGDPQSAKTLRLSGEMQGEKMIWRVTN